MQNRTRNKQIILRFTEDESEYFKNFKEKTQISNYSDFVLHLLTHFKIYVVDTKPLLKVANEINKIGINVNQIAKIANTTGNLYKNEIEELKERIIKTENIIQSVFEVFTAAEKGKL